MLERGTALVESEMKCLFFSVCYPSNHFLHLVLIFHQFSKLKKLRERKILVCVSQRGFSKGGSEPLDAIPNLTTRCH